MTFVDRVREAARRRVAYWRTVDEIRRMPLDVALDLDIHRDDAPRIARDAIDGR